MQTTHQNSEKKSNDNCSNVGSKKNPDGELRSRDKKGWS
jgi:hypothetical protein